MEKIVRKSKGFTIIEVLIVLAIAGLIMVVVFLAVPSLQRAGRNNAYSTNANNILSAVNTYMVNNNGTTPAFISNPVSGVVTVSLASGSTTDNKETANVDAGLTTSSLVQGSAIPATKPAPGVLYVVVKSICSGNTPVSSTSGRALAVWYGTESGSGDIAKCIGS